MYAGGGRCDNDEDDKDDDGGGIGTAEGDDGADERETRMGGEAGGPAPQIDGLKKRPRKDEVDSEALCMNLLSTDKDTGPCYSGSVERSIFQCKKRPIRAARG
jgi:hypothetical protein